MHTYSLVMSSGISGVSINLQLTESNSEKTTGFSNLASISLECKVTYVPWDMHSATVLSKGSSVFGGKQ